MKKTIQYRQGDVLIEQVPELPNQPKKTAAQQQRVILAHGSATGHSHEIEDPTAAALEPVDKLVNAPGDLSDATSTTNAVMVLERPTAVIHQEHSRIELPAGQYIVRRQREYSPTEIRNVLD